jgi:chromosomal replication initiation ATPase DnaA
VQPVQVPLPLAWAERRERADFIVSDSNRAAFAWVADPARWPMPRALLIGPEGAGKSHMAALFAGRVIEDADRLADGEPLFHAWNAATSAQPLLLTARTVPRDWAHGLPDLASRLAATPQASIAEPDDALLAAVLRKRFADRGLHAGPELIAYLAMRIERSFAAVAGIVHRLDALAMAEHRELSVPLARELLEAQGELGV